MRDEGAPGSRRGERGPVLRKAPGPIGWYDPRSRGVGSWAFALHRITGLGLVFYLYLHLAVLSQLLRGASAWDGFLRLATTPAFLGLDVLLIFGLLVHGLNGIRVTLIGTGAVADRHKALFWALMAMGAVVLVYAALHVFEDA